MAQILDERAISRKREAIDKIAISIGNRASQCLGITDSAVWREAGILSGALARLQGYDKGRDRRLLNDAFLFVSMQGARRIDVSRAPPS